MSHISTHLCGPDLWDQFSYNPFTGKLHNRATDEIIFGTVFNEISGYKSVRLTARVRGLTKTYNYSRIVFAWFYGYFPQKGYHIDHVNHDTQDNRISNLRCVTVRENNQNRRGQKSPGIYWNKRLRKWQAQIRVGPKRVYLGIYVNEHDALLAYIQACDLYGYPVLRTVRQRLDYLLLAAPPKSVY